MTIMERERTHFVQLTPKIRARLEATLDNLIGLLDALDGDADAEEITACEFDPAYGRMAAEFTALDPLWQDDREAGDDEESGEQPPVWLVPATVASAAA